MKTSFGGRVSPPRLLFEGSNGAWSMAQTGARAFATEKLRGQVPDFSEETENGVARNEQTRSITDRA